MTWFDLAALLALVAFLTGLALPGRRAGRALLAFLFLSMLSLVLAGLPDLGGRVPLLSEAGRE